MRHYWPQYLLTPFTALTVLVQLLITPFYKPGKIRWRAGALEVMDNTPGSMDTNILGNPGGQTFGGRIIWYNMASFVERRIIPVHERVHIHHAEWINAVAHMVLVLPVVLLCDSVGLTVCSVLLAQSAFGLAYGGHFLWEMRKLGWDWKRWADAYRKIFTERIAYRIDDEFKNGVRPDAWGGG